MVLEPFREALSQHQRLKGFDEPVRIAHLSDWSSFSGGSESVRATTGESTTCLHWNAKHSRNGNRGCRGPINKPTSFSSPTTTALPVAAEDADSGEKVRTVPGPM